MKKLFVFISLTFAAFACSGDCLSCHPSLGGGLGRDADHKVLLDCVICHKEITNPNAECGGNCVSCHANINKEIPEHLTLGECKSCHISSGGQSGFLNDMFGSSQQPDRGETLERKFERVYKEPK